MSKPIQLRETSRDDWQSYLGECYETGADAEALLAVFLTSKDLIRAALSVQQQRAAEKRSEARKVITMNRRG